MASAFFVSPFDQAACMSIDGFGDFSSAKWGIGRGSSIKTLGTVGFPHSLGIFYTAITQYLGFPNYGDEYKVMGLASYGEPEYLDVFRRIVRLTADGFALDLDYFVHHKQGAPMNWNGSAPALGRIYSDELVRRLGPARESAAPIEPRHMNLAASLQSLTEEIYLGLLQRLQQTTRMRAVCVAGGVAFNSVANGGILEETGFDDVYIQPAAGDAGTAIGAAYSVWHSSTRRPRDFVMRHSFWGPEYSDESIRLTLETRRRALTESSIAAELEDDDDRLCARAAEAIASGLIVGWFQGRMEWGPRALGNRSILADPRRAGMKDVLNLKIKNRESFRPFCPSILLEHAPEYFESSYPEPFMLKVYRVKPDKREFIPAVTHVDGTGRLQTVSKEENPRYYKLIERFYRLTGVPVLLNTSFNENEPIVRSPDDAIDCFLRTEIDLLIIGDRILARPAAVSLLRWNETARAANGRGPCSSAILGCAFDRKQLVGQSNIKKSQVGKRDLSPLLVATDRSLLRS